MFGFRLSNEVAGVFSSGGGMRASVFLVILAGFTHPAYRTKRVTVADLEHTLAAARDLPDGEVAKQLSDLELT